MAGQPNPYPPPPPGAQPYAFGPPGAPPPPPPDGWQPQKPTSGKAVASLVCAIAGLLVGFFCPIALPAIVVGLILGFLAIAETGRNGKRSGRGLAIAATIVSVLAMAGGVARIAHIVMQIGKAVEESTVHFENGLEDDVELIASRMKLYCEQNGGTLHPGGPILAKGGDAPEKTAFNSAPEGPAPTHVSGALTVSHLVGGNELGTARRYEFTLTVTGPTTATPQQARRDRARVRHQGCREGSLVGAVSLGLPGRPTPAGFQPDTWWPAMALRRF